MGNLLHRLDTDGFKPGKPNVYQDDQRFRYDQSKAAEQAAGPDVSRVELVKRIANLEEMIRESRKFSEVDLSQVLLDLEDAKLRLSLTKRGQE